MKTKVTNRGFAYRNFTDNKRVKCSIQESSNAMKACIWLGSDSIGLHHFTSINEPGGRGWVSIKEPDEVNSIKECYIANTRMELDQEMVKNLLPALKHFAKYGTLPE